MKHIECDITFSRDYLSSHFGLRYGPEYFSDIRHRVDTDQKATRGIWERFGNIGLGVERPPAVARLGYDDTLNITLTYAGPSALRIESDYSWIQTPLSAEACRRILPISSVADTWPHSTLLEQYDEALRTWGKDSIVAPKVHGIFESALDLRGIDFLVDMLADREAAEYLLDVLTQTVIDVKEFWDRTVYGEVRPGLSLGACSTPVLSPELVRELLLPRYQQIASRFGEAFVCSCGNSTLNLENFASLRDTPYVRNGWGTDFEKTAEILQGKCVKASLDVVRASTRPEDEVKNDVWAALSRLEPIDRVSILLINVGKEIPDGNIRAIVRGIHEFADREEIVLSDRGTCNLTVARAYG